MRKGLQLAASLPVVMTLLVLGCAGNHEGMESPRKLTAHEKMKAFDIALNTSEVLRQLELENEYKTELDWIAIVWKNSEYSEWQMIDYEWEEDENLKLVPESAVFYPWVIIRFGEPERWHVVVAVDLDTEKAVLVDEFIPRMFPPSDTGPEASYSPLYSRKPESA